MKNFFLITALLYSSVQLFSQNYMANPSFESVTVAPPASIFGGQVDSWFSFGNSPVATNAHLCHPVTVTAQDQLLFADGIHVGQAIVNVLARPILPYQKLDISYWALITGCSRKPAYIVEFYVSNTATNTANGFPLFPNPSQYLKVGQKYIFNPNDIWKPYTTTLQVNPYPFNPVPCNYKYLIVVLRNPPFLTGAPESA